MAKAKANKAAKKAAKKAVKTSTGAWEAVFAQRSPGEKRYWLVKSEPEVFSFDDLLNLPNKTTHWNGIRNFAARNFMRDGMKIGDRVFFYHSMSDAQAIVGICEVVREGYPDDSAFDRTSEGYDPKSDKAMPTWYMVDLRAVAQFTRPVTLAEIKRRKGLESMALLRIGRLSVSPVTAGEWEIICAMAS
ncbi:MAG: EVE domain-containing protein [Gemmatimonadaceae bacterium]